GDALTPRLRRRSAPGTARSRRRRPSSSATELGRSALACRVVTLVPEAGAHVRLAGPVIRRTMFARGGRMRLRGMMLGGLALVAAAAVVLAGSAGAARTALPTLNVALTGAK